MVHCVRKSICDLPLAQQVYLLSWNKETLYFVKTCSLWFVTVTYKEKMFVTNNYSTLDHSLFWWVFYFYITKIFVHLSVIAAVCYFSVNKLIGWDPENIYLFKVSYRTLEEGVNNMTKVNNKKSRKSFWCLYCKFLTLFHTFFSVSIVDFE